MKKLILFVFILSSVFGYAQDTTQVNSKKEKRFFLGINFSPDYCFRTLVNNDGGAVGAMIIGFRNQLEIPKFGFTSGINIGYKISKYISAEIGLQYSNKGYQEKTINYNNNTTPRRGFSYPTSGKIIYSYNCLDIPIKANFTFGKKQIRFICSLGLITNIYIAETNSFVGKDNNGSTYKNSSTTTSGFNRFNLTPAISVGVQFGINQKMFFRIEPTFKYGVLKMTNTPITQYIWNAGLNVSWYFL
jgi:hypothetical protein